MAKNTDKAKGREHEEDADGGIGYRGCEPRIEEPPIPPAHKKGQSSVHKKRKK